MRQYRGAGYESTDYVAIRRTDPTHIRAAASRPGLGQLEPKWLRIIISYVMLSPLVPSFADVFLHSEKITREGENVELKGSVK